MCYMGSTWVAQVAVATSGIVGIVFTWLVGFQSRKHSEVMAARSEEGAQIERLVREKREAYLALLRLIGLALRHERYRREGAVDQLRALEGIWPKGERVRMTIDSVVAVEVFGSAEAREIVEQWRQKEDVEVARYMTEQELRVMYRQLVDLVRRELGPTSLR